MSRKDEIKAEISALKKKIVIYQKNVDGLERTRETATKKLESFKSSVCTKIKAYDIYCNGTWKGTEASKAETEKENSMTTSLLAQKDVENLLDDIKHAIQKYKKMIEDCRNKIKKLNHELSSLKE